MPTIRCCVLGATGFIGGQIARAAVARGWQVRGLRRRPHATGAVGDLEVEWVSGDLADPASLVAAMRGCPLVFHAAAYYPHRARDVWDTVRHGVTGMRNVLAAASAAGVKRLVYTSALTTVGPPSDPRQLAGERDLYTPGSVPLPYFEVKWAMEMEAARATAQGLPVVTLLPTAVFGPGDVKPTTGVILLMVARGQLPVTVEGTINVVDGRDVAAGHVAAAERGRPGRRYILGGHNLTFPGMRVWPKAFLLIHFPVRTHAQGAKKILKERLPIYSKNELAAAWHTHYKPMKSPQDVFDTYSKEKDKSYAKDHLYEAYQDLVV